MDAAVNSVGVLNRSELRDGEIALMVEGARGELARFCEAWSLPRPGLVVYPRTHEQNVADESVLIFVDSANEPDAFGYHTVLGKARFGYIDVGMCRFYGEPPSRVFFHELWELLLDPDCDRWLGPYPDGSHVALECADPCQRSSRAKHVVDSIFGEGDIVVAAFVLPIWFDPTSSGPWDDQNSTPGPLLCADGGYMISERNGVVLVHGAQRTRNNGRTFRRLVKGRR